MRGTNAKGIVLVSVFRDLAARRWDARGDGSARLGGSTDQLRGPGLAMPAALGTRSDVVEDIARA